MLPKDNYPEGRTWIGLERELGEQRAWGKDWPRGLTIRKPRGAWIDAVRLCLIGMSWSNPAINPVLECRNDSSQSIKLICEWTPAPPKVRFGYRIAPAPPKTPRSSSSSSARSAQPATHLPRTLLQMYFSSLG